MNPTRPLFLSLALAGVFTVTGSAQHSAAHNPSDADITAQVKQTIAQEDALKGPDVSITPTVHNGVVTLEGHVPNKAAKVLVSTEIGQIRGVKSIMNDLDIAPTAAATVPRPPAPAAPAKDEADVYKPLDLPVPQTLPIRTVQEINTKTVKVGDTFMGSSRCCR